MNLFGVDITLAKRDSNGKYVKKEECREVHKKLECFIRGEFENTNRRIDDFRRSVMVYIDLLNKK